MPDVTSNEVPNSVVRTMHIPEHISVTGESMPIAGDDNSRGVERARVMQMMNVPEKIVLDGGDRYKGYMGDPTDVSGILHTQPVNGLDDLPSHLTLADERTYPDEPVSHGHAHEEVRSASSIAIDENPLQELKHMRRQLGRLSTRMYQIEEELEMRRVRENQYLMTTLIGVAAAILAFLIRR